MSVDRLVVDTNVLISAALSPQGPPAQFLQHLHESSAVLVFSELTFTELATRIMRTKFDRYVDQELRLKFLAEIDAVAEFVGVTGAPMGCRDRSDDAFLETALAGDCDLIVTGDEDLLIMNPWREIQILSPAQVIEGVESGRRRL